MIDLRRVLFLRIHWLHEEHWLGIGRRPQFCTDMVNTTISIPKNYTASPSSFGGTPHLTINHDVTADLDSTNAFEGELQRFLRL